MNIFNIAIPIISHIIAALYLQKQKFNKFITACFWGLFVVIAFGILVFLKKPQYMFTGLLLAQLLIFCIATVGPFGEKLFLFLTYANSFSICIGINLILSSLLPNNIFLFLCTTAIIILMHLFVYNVLIHKYKAAKNFFTTGWWKIIIVLILFLIQFLNQYAFNIVDKTSALNLLFDFIIFSIIFNATLIIIFDSVKFVSKINKKTYENNILKDIANKDILTNMQNRLAYISYTKEKINNQTNDNSSFIFVMLDIDNFKNINDTRGHAEGDKILKLVGSNIIEYFDDPNCHSYRIGGDEFVLLIENTPLADVQENMTKFNQKLQNNNNVTISFGCCIVDFNNKNPFEVAYKKADLIMYNNKQHKNTVQM